MTIFRNSQKTVAFPWMRSHIISYKNNILQEDPMQFSFLPDFLCAQTDDSLLDQTSPLTEDAAIDDQLAAFV